MGTEGAPVRPTITLDTNRLIAAVGNSHGPAGLVLAKLLASELILLLSADVVEEYRTRADRPSVIKLFARHQRSAAEYLRLVDLLTVMAVKVVPTGEAPACRDETDRKFLHCAVAGSADYLVTGDHDLLVLGSVGATAIVTPAELLRRIAAPVVD